MIAAASGAPLWLDVTVGALLVVAMLGVVVPLLPGTALAWAAIVVWAVVERSTTGWLVLLVASGAAAVGFVVKYLVPSRRLNDRGVPNSTTLVGGVLGVVGFFVVPVVGAPLGFVLGVYLAEWARLRAHSLAWRSTRTALGAVGLAMLIELTAVALMAGVWMLGVGRLSPDRWIAGLDRRRSLSSWSEGEGRRAPQIARGQRGCHG